MILCTECLTKYIYIEFIAFSLHGANEMMDQIWKFREIVFLDEMKISMMLHGVTRLL